MILLSSTLYHDLKHHESNSQHNDIAQKSADENPALAKP